MTGAASVGGADPGPRGTARRPGAGSAATGVRLEVAGPVATITLDRPEARNVLTEPGMVLLAAHLRAAGSDPSVRVIVLTGSGSTFCAGADLRGASTAGSDAFSGRGPGALVDVLEAMLDVPKPVIARVQGHVAGGGNGLVAAADLCVAVESARFAFSEVRLGLAPAVISVVCLARMHRGEARELFLTGERVPAQRMLRAGLLNRVVPEGQLDEAVATWVAELTAGGPEAIAHTKSLLRVIPGLGRDEAFRRAAAVSAERFASAEAAAGMAAFLSGSPAPWAPGR